MERADELKERIRQQPLNDRLEESRRRIGDMCSKGRCPKMTIPVQHDDDDFYINTTLADAQATIAALQARVKELEAIKIPDDAFTYCAYCGEKSPVDEHNEDLSAHIKVCPKHPIRDVEAQLTQRTAELERVRGERDAADALNSEMIVLLADYVGETGVSEGAVDVLRRKLVELATLRTLIAALPKVEGELTCSQQIDSAWRLHYWQVEAYGVADECIYRLSNLGEEEAKAYAALLQHRQGMEG